MHAVYMSKYNSTSRQIEQYTQTYDQTCALTVDVKVLIWGCCRTPRVTSTFAVLLVGIFLVVTMIAPRMV